MTLIVRRPHAYRFKQTYPEAPIPGLTILDAKGKVVGTVRVPSKGAVDDLVAIFAQANEPK